MIGALGGGAMYYVGGSCAADRVGSSGAQWVLDGAVGWAF